MRMKKAVWQFLLCTIFGMALTGCAGEKDQTEQNETQNTQTENTQNDNQIEQNDNAKAQNEEAAGGTPRETVDFKKLQEENPDIFAWLYVPGTNIDMPLLQSPEEDDYYSSHDHKKQESANGALYTEMANLMNFCDFNTIIHGQDQTDKDPFYELHQFENPEFFARNNKFYVYLPDNVLTYEIYAAYDDESSDILRRFDYTTMAGCESYLEQIQNTRDLGKNIREGWEELTPYHFLVTLNGSVKEQDNTQFVVIGVLVGDAAGKIDRVILD